MYSTLEGAKKCAKRLKNILERSGFSYPLVKCQTAVAQAGGYDDWHDLNRRIRQRVTTDLPYDYWGKLIGNLPAPCHLAVRSYLREYQTFERSDETLVKCWVRDTMPYLMSLEVVHRSTTKLLRPGSGKDQKLRANIVSGMLLNMEGTLDFLEPLLDPESLTAIFQGPPDAILPKLAKHPRFNEAIEALAKASILTVDRKTTQISAPDSDELHAEIIRRARSWKVQIEPEIDYWPMGTELSAAVQHQNELDRKQAGPKVPYDALDYRGVSLQSLYSVASEFKAMKAVVDAMSDDVRQRLASVWCDSKACATYHVVVSLGMHHDALAEQVRQCFLAATSGFNGLSVQHGSHETQFDPEWPADEAYFAELRDDQPLL